MKGRLNGGIEILNLIVRKQEGVETFVTIEVVGIEEGNDSSL